MPEPPSAEAATFTNAATATAYISDDANDDVVLDRIVLEAMENERDRVMILQFESQIESFVKDDTRTRLSFPPMSSYHRLILHRVAQFYKVDHPSQLLPDGKRQILLVKQTFSRIPRIRICDMDVSSSSNSSSSTNPVQVAAPPMRIMRRAQVESKPEQIQSTGLTESEASLQSREEAYAKARAKLFELDQSAQGDSPPPDLVYSESKSFDIEPHEHDLYRRNVGLYSRASSNAPSMYNIGQAALPQRFQPYWAYCRTGIPPMSQNSASLGPLYWPRAGMVPPADNRGYVPFYDPLQSRQTVFSPPVQPFFANAANVEYGSWTSNGQERSDTKVDYSFCTSMLEIYDLPKDAKNYQVDIILDSLKQRNCSLKWIADGRVIAVFDTASEALDALQTVNDPRYKLRPWSGAM